MKKEIIKMLPTVIENIPQLVFWKDTHGDFSGCNKQFSDSLGLSRSEEIIGKTETEYIKTIEGQKEIIKMLPTVIENIPQLVFWKDTHGVFLGCNKRFSDSLGLSCPEEIIGKTDYDVTDKENAKAFVAEDKEVILTNTPLYKNKQSLKNTEGEELWFNINRVPLYDSDSKIIGILGTMENITEQVNLEIKLISNNEKYKSLIESTNTAYMILNEQLEIMETNVIFLQILRAKALYDIIGRPIFLWIAPKYSKIFEDSFQNLLKGNAINDLELHLLNEKNDIVCVSLHANLIENGSKKIFCLVRNISARKAQESEKFIKEQKKKDKLRQNILALKAQISNNIKKFEGGS